MWIIYAKSVVFGMAVLFRTILCSSNLGSFIRSCALYKMGLKFLQSYIVEFWYSSCNFTKPVLIFSLLLKVLLKICLLHKVWCRYCTHRMYCHYDFFGKSFSCQNTLTIYSANHFKTFEIFWKTLYWKSVLLGFYQKTVIIDVTGLVFDRINRN